MTIHAQRIELIAEPMPHPDDYGRPGLAIGPPTQRYAERRGWGLAVMREPAPTTKPGLLAWVRTLVEREAAVAMAEREAREPRIDMPRIEPARPTEDQIVEAFIQDPELMKRVGARLRAGGVKR